MSEAEPADGAARVRVVLVDDHAVVRRGLRSFLSIYPDIDVVAEAANGDDAIAVIAVAQSQGTLPDVVLMDLAMERLDGVEATRRIRSRWPEVEVVALTSFVDEARVLEALDAGASGYIIKDAPAEEIVLAIRAAHRGEMMVDPALARKLLTRGRQPTARGPFAELTEREREVLGLVAQGLNNNDIARALTTSERTARTHVSNVLRKLGLASRTQAALYAVEHRLDELR